MCTEANVIALDECADCVLEAIPTLAEEAGVEIVFGGEWFTNQYAGHV